MDEKNTNNEEAIEKEETTSENIQISDEVVSVIAGKAVSEVSGVAEMAGGFARGNYRSFKRKEKFI